MPRRAKRREIVVGIIRSGHGTGPTTSVEGLSRGPRVPLNLRQLTQDHTAAALGETKKGRANTLTRAIGAHPTVNVDVIVDKPVPGDLYLLCTDGLTAKLDAGVIARTLSKKREDLDRAAKKLVLAANRRGRAGQHHGDPRCRPRGSPLARRGWGVQVTRGLRLPFIGTSVTMAGPSRARWLAKMCVGEPLVNLELHGIDVLDASDGLEALRAHQPDVKIPTARKTAAILAAIEELRSAGYTFVTMREAAEAFAASS